MANVGARRAARVRRQATAQVNFVEADLARIIDGLFSRAREVDEFEYASTLLRVRGMEDYGWDPLVETDALFENIVSLLHAPLNDYAAYGSGCFSIPT